MNYMGGKHKLLPQLLPLFPDDARVFVDLFTGGLDVSLNAEATSRICVDLNAPVIALYQAIQAKPIGEVLAHVNGRVKKYELSKTNVEGYRKLRDLYNQRGNPLDLFVLIAHSFNHQARFNNDHKFNTPFGTDRSCFNPAMRDNLTAMVQYVQDHEFEFVCDDFRSVSLEEMTPADFLYADPPYLISSGTYNDGNRGFGGWGPDEDHDLRELLDGLAARGIPWAMSNVTHHKGETNGPLLRWAKQYTVQEMKFHYNNSNYQTSAGGAKTREVVITNLAVTR
jgi:DNA adenine methylase Dam